MPIFFVVSLLLVQAPTTTPRPAQQPIDVNGKKIPKQKCEYMEVTGSHTRQRVCRDDSGRLDLGPNVTDSVAPGVSHNTPVAQPGGFGPTPQ